MKISTASKKVLASALSAAMVVAFAPTVAFGAVSTDGDKTDASAPVVAGDEVASVVYYTVKDGKTTENVQKFYSDDADTDDNALQAAAAFAGSVKDIKAGTAVTVKLNKDVKVDTPYAQGIQAATNGTGLTSGKTLANTTYYTVSADDAGKLSATEIKLAKDTPLTAGSETIAGGTYGSFTYNGKAIFVSAGGAKSVLAKADTNIANVGGYVHDSLKVSGTVTVDLNGHTLTNAGKTAIELAQQSLNYIVAGDAVTKTVTTFVDTFVDADAAVMLNDYVVKAATAAIQDSEGAGKTITSVIVSAIAADPSQPTKAKLTVSYDVDGVSGSNTTQYIDAIEVDKAVIAETAKKYDVNAAKAGATVSIDSADANAVKYGKYAPTSSTTSAVADELTGTSYFAGGKSGSSAADGTGTAKKYVAKYTVTQAEQTKTYAPAAAADVTIADSAEAKGAVKATKNAAVDVNAQKLTINGAVISAENPYSTADAVSAAVIGGAGSTIKLKGGASVASTLEGYIELGGAHDDAFDNGTDVNDTFGIHSAGAVEVVKATDAEIKANKDAAYDKVAGVTATLTKGATATGNAAVATAVSALNLDVLRNAEFTATSEATASTSGAQAGGNGAGIGSGVIVPTATASLASSTAVDLTGASKLYYGTYNADFAVKGNDQATIKYGTYNGYVEKATAAKVTGGKFKYAPTEKTTYIDAASTEQIAQAKMGDATDFANLSIAKGNDYYYVFRTSQYTPPVKKGELAGTVVSMDLQAPKGATKASGAAYADVDEYLQDKYLSAKTASVVLSEDEVGIDLNDGNKTDRLKLTGELTYGNPYSEQDKAKNPEAFAAMEEAAAANTQHIAGIYGVNLELDYGVDPATGKAVKYQDVTDLNGTQLTIAMGPAATDSKPAAYYIENGKATALETTTQDAILAGAAGKAFVTTDKIGTFGLTYSSAEDIQNQAAAAELAQLKQQAAALGIQGYENMNKAELTAAIAEAKANGAVAAVPQTLYTALNSKTVKYSTLKKKAVTIKIKGQAANKVTYKVTKKASKKISVSKSGVVTMKKGAKKGTYKVTVTAAAGNGLKSAKKTVTIKVK